MSWTEARTGASTATRQLAHEDQAKNRRDESHATRGSRVRPRWLWPVGAATILVLVAGSAAVALMTAGDDSPARPRADTSATPPGTQPESSVAPTGDPPDAVPLSGTLTASGPVTSTSTVGSPLAFQMTVRLQCAASCRVTVLEAPEEFRVAAAAYVERTFEPAGDGSYETVLDEPLADSGGQVQPGCEALRVRGSGTLVRDGESVSITVQHEGDQLDGANGNQCALADRMFAFVGTLA